MFDIGWTEIVLAAVVALVVLGPRDLPHALRLLGRWTRRIRQMARDFHNSLDFDTRDDHHPATFEQINRIGGDQAEETVPADTRMDQGRQTPPSEKSTLKKTTREPEKPEASSP